MATELKKKVRRKINKPHFLRKSLIVEIEPPDILRLYEKGARKNRYEIGLEALYVLLVKRTGRQK